MILSADKYELKCYLVKDVIMLFWYLFHVEQILRNDNNINVDMVETAYENN